jgi:hypothetical protein
MDPFVKWIEKCTTEGLEYLVSKRLLFRAPRATFIACAYQRLVEEPAALVVLEMGR